MTYEEFLAIALEFHEAEEVVGGRELYVQRGKDWMFTLKKDGETVAVKLDWANHDHLLAAHPGTLFKTPHYGGYPALLIRLADLREPLAREILQASWEDAPLKARKRSATKNSASPGP